MSTFRLIEKSNQYYTKRDVHKTRKIKVNANFHAIRAVFTVLLPGLEVNMARCF